MCKSSIYGICAFLIGIVLAEDEVLHKDSVLKSVIYASPSYAATISTFQWQDMPLHSSDIAKSFTYIPGFAMTRKGGGGSEIYYRSQGASRLPIFIDGSMLNGGCGGRMDTTITYLFPQNYHTLTILKGPQDVRYGGLVAGGILFERQSTRLESNTFKANADLLYGSFGHFDVNASALVGGKYGSLEAIVSDYSSNDYKAANGNTIHSAYDRQSISLIGTLTPAKDTLLELQSDLSRGEAAYADRGMDGRSFDRISFMFKIQQKFSSSIPLLDMRVWHNNINHIMDNFTLRPNTTQNFNISNPKRTNTGAKIELTLKPTQSLKLYIGSTYFQDTHKSRQQNGATSASEANALLNATNFTPNFRFANLGTFIQGEFLGDSHYGLFFGLRYDALQTRQYATHTNITDNLISGFGRYEYYLANTTLFAGLGVAQRGADFWERSKNNGMNLAPETNTQADFGIVYENKEFSLSALGFYSFAHNYMVLHYGTSTSAFNTDAMLTGGELEARYTLFDILHLYGSISYTYAQNLKSNYGLKAHTPIPQIAPLAARFSLVLENRGWLLRTDIYANAAQHRYALDYGNVIGKDLGASAGFYTLSLYGGYQYKKISFLLGVENLTNTLYAYHLSRNSVAINMLDNPANVRVYEPGRNVWVKIKTHF